MTKILNLKGLFVSTVTKRHLEAMQVVVIEVYVGLTVHAQQVQHFLAAETSAALKARLPLEAYLLRNDWGKAEVNEDGLVEARAKGYVVGLDVNVNNVKAVHDFQLLLQSPEPTQRDIVNHYALLHRYLNAVLEHNDVESEETLKPRCTLKSRADFQ